jgi:hypothetical protein
LATASLFFLLVAVTVNAQQINGTPGLPSATTNDRFVFENCFRKPSNTIYCGTHHQSTYPPMDDEVTDPMKKQAVHVIRTLSPFLATVTVALTFVSPPSWVESQPFLRK